VGDALKAVVTVLGKIANQLKLRDDEPIPLDKVVAAVAYILGLGPDPTTAPTGTRPGAGFPTMPLPGKFIAVKEFLPLAPTTWPAASFAVFDPDVTAYRVLVEA